MPKFPQGSDGLNGVPSEYTYILLGDNARTYEERVLDTIDKMRDDLEAGLNDFFEDVRRRREGAQE